MYALNQEDYDKYKGPLFRHFMSSIPSTSDKSDSTEESRINTQKQFIHAYFTKFLKKGGESTDHFDLQRLERDDYGIPQDMSKRYFIMAQQDHGKVPSSLNHIPPWLIRHYEYAVQLSLDFFNEQKFKKMRELRRSQRDLPISERKTEIIGLLEKNQVLIIAGDTGCGKSTQVPQYLLASGYTGIACTQPRRIACTALAKRVAYETLNTYGSEVAYQIRDLVEKRSDIKLILMSATINLELFSAYFENSPVIQVPGRLYPIKLRYHPIKQFIDESEKKNYKIDPEPYVRILELIDKETPSSERGDSLIFLNGIAEMTTVAETLKTYAELTKAWIVLMLHSGLSVEEQDKVFDVAPQGVRKCILSTNIAETSVTIDGIRFVIDSGKVNLIKHEADSGIQKLSEFWVSKASANQRKGRAGRTGPGTCFRLYSEEQFDKMEDFTPSEINRVSLQEMALRMISLNLGLDPLTFPYIERPADDALNEAIELLKFQGVLYADRENHLTALGNCVAKLPVDVSIAKMLILGCVVDQLEVMLTVAGGLSVQSPFTNRSFRDLDVVERRASLTSPLGDPFTLVAIFREWVMQKAFGGKARRWAMDNGIDEHRLYEIAKLRSQYRQVLEDAGLVPRLGAGETGADDSRQRRIDKGDRQKLIDMKRDARNSERQVKVLRSGKHFDTILAEKEEQDIEEESEPLKADVKTVEFLLSHKQRDVETIRTTHKLRRKDAQVIRIVIAAGLYPQFAVLDPLNKYSHGQEMFAHTRQKPFSNMHPNSSVTQYHPESLDPRCDTEGQSSLHQAPFYGLFLETTKPYLCNVLPMPMATLLIVAKKVICDDWRAVGVDDFVDIEFSKDNECRELFSYVRAIRREMARGLKRKLQGDEFDSRELIKMVDRFFGMISEQGGVGLKWKRMVNPPRRLDQLGFYQPDGEVLFGDEKKEVGSDGDEEAEDDNIINEERRIRDSMAFDATCPETIEAREEREEEEEKERKKEEKKESYYDILLRKRSERESVLEEESRGSQPKKRFKTGAE